MSIPIGNTASRALQRALCLVVVIGLVGAGQAGEGTDSRLAETPAPLAGRDARPTGGGDREAHDSESMVELLGAVVWQAALDRAGFSPGVIDGIVGPKTRAGLRAFQVRAGLAATGMPDASTLAALGFDAEPPLSLYVLTEADAALVGPCPTDWVAKSELKHLGYDSLAALAAERGHCTKRLLATLNAGRDLEGLEPGDMVLLPNVGMPRPVPQAASVAIDYGEQLLRVMDDAGETVGLFHCSIPADREGGPAGPCLVETIVMDPPYLFDPASWPELRGRDRRLTIPPGPRNPVGVCWIGLSVKGYGIHGTPKPELIGKTGSHGCIRLTNWDVLRLAGMVKIGMEVRFEKGGAAVAGRLGHSLTRLPTRD